MVVFDELPLTSLMDSGGRSDAERYPALARLAGDANWSRGATAVHDSSALAVPAMLTAFAWLLRRAMTQTGTTTLWRFAIRPLK